MLSKVGLSAWLWLQTIPAGETIPQNYEPAGMYSMLIRVRTVTWAEYCIYEHKKGIGYERHKEILTMPAHGYAVSLHDAGASGKCGSIPIPVRIGRCSGRVRGRLCKCKRKSERQPIDQYDRDGAGL